MKIGFIGVGLIGEVLARKVAAAGHQVKIANSRGPETLKELADKIGTEAVPVEQVVQDVDVVFLVIPQRKVSDLPKDLFKKSKKGFIVVDVGNYYPLRDGSIEEIENGLTESAWVEKQIGDSVIKAFNSINWRSLDALSSPKGTLGRIALPVSGDDAKTKKVIADLVDQLGYEPYDAGAIAESWRQQPGAPIYCTNVTLDEMRMWHPKLDRSTLPARRSLGLKLHAELLAQDKEKDAKAYGRAMKDALLKEHI